MKLNLNFIKQKILEGTQGERVQIQGIYEKSCKKAMATARRKRCFALLYISIFVWAIWHWGNPVAAIITAVIVVLLIIIAGTSFYTDALEKILNEDKQYQILIKSIKNKKNLIVKEDGETIEYLLFLQQYVEVYLHNKCFSFVEILGSETQELQDKKDALQKRIQSVFLETEFFVFDKTYTDVHFSFSFTYTNKSLLGTEKTLTISLDDEGVENEIIHYQSWENTW